MFKRDNKLGGAAGQDGIFATVQDYFWRQARRHIGANVAQADEFFVKDSCLRTKPRLRTIHCLISFIAGDGGVVVRLARPFTTNHQLIIDPT
jgi:hypothetical protein